MRGLKEHFFAIASGGHQEYIPSAVSMISGDYDFDRIDLCDMIMMDISYIRFGVGFDQQF